MNTLHAFLSSSWFAEESASPAVARLLAHPCDAEERAVLIAYAAEEDEHARLLAELFARRGLQRGQPFWIQPVLDAVSGRTELVLQMFHLELMAGMFYAGVARGIDDVEVKALIRRLLRDEARHIRLFRGLARKQLATLTGFEALRARAFVYALQAGAYVTAQYQTRQLAPLLGPRGRSLPARVWAQFVSEREGLFRRGEGDVTITFA